MCVTSKTDPGTALRVDKHFKSQVSLKFLEQIDETKWTLLNEYRAHSHVDANPVAIVSTLLYNERHCWWPAGPEVGSRILTRIGILERHAWPWLSSTRIAETTTWVDVSVDMAEDGQDWSAGGSRAWGPWNPGMLHSCICILSATGCSLWMEMARVTEVSAEVGPVVFINQEVVSAMNNVHIPTHKAHLQA